jgi:hypothetical protein
LRNQGIAALILAGGVVLAGCDQPLAARVSPQPQAPPANGAREVLGGADASALARTQWMVRALVAGYEAPGSALHAEIDAAAARARQSASALGEAAAAGEAPPLVRSLDAVVRQLAAERSPAPRAGDAPPR